jgi:hypothetical protein
MEGMIIETRGKNQEEKLGRKQAVANMKRANMIDQAKMIPENMNQAK